MRAIACAATIAIVCLAGCGSASKPSAPSLAEGAHVFASSCAGCHTLEPGPPGRQAPPGGPLAGYRMTTAQLQSFVRNMPVPRPLSDRQLKAVVAFVAQAQRTRGR